MQCFMFVVNGNYRSVPKAIDNNSTEGSEYYKLSLNISYLRRSTT